MLDLLQLRERTFGLRDAEWTVPFTLELRSMSFEVAGERGGEHEEALPVRRVHVIDPISGEVGSVTDSSLEAPRLVLRDRGARRLPSTLRSGAWRGDLRLRRSGSLQGSRGRLPERQASAIERSDEVIRAPSGLPGGVLPRDIAPIPVGDRDRAAGRWVHRGDGSKTELRPVRVVLEDHPVRLIDRRRASAGAVPREDPRGQEGSRRQGWRYRSCAVSERFQSCHLRWWPQETMPHPLRRVTVGNRFHHPRSGSVWIVQLRIPCPRGNDPA
jgi:hypothetical protein